MRRRRFAPSFPRSDLLRKGVFMKVGWTGLLVLCCSGLASADDVLLTNGRTLVGIACEEEGRWVIRTRFGDIRVPADEVRRVVPGRTALHEFDERLADVEACPTASEMFSMAQWAQEKGLIRYVHTLLARTIELDPDHPKARRLLDFVPFEGQWVRYSQKTAILAERDLSCKACPSPSVQEHPRHQRSIETTPYTLGIPMTPEGKHTGHGSSGGYSIWQGVWLTNNLLNLPVIVPRGTR